MSKIWKFSSFSEPYVERLLESVSIENDNKWSEKFKNLSRTYLDYFNNEKSNNEYNNASRSHDEDIVNTDTTSETVEDKLNTNKYYDEIFCKSIELEPELKIDYMVEECLKNPNLVINLAENLSTNATEKICNTIFTKNNIDMEFISMFLTIFFPIFLKREQSWVALDLLFKADKTYPKAFKPVLALIIKDVNIKSTVLQEFMMRSNAEMQNFFISSIMNVNFTFEMFNHHLYTIYMVYKDCKKTENVQNFIQSKLIENAPHCTIEKNYGRLFLAFLQAQKTLGYKTKSFTLERVIELHNSPFKRPCLSVLNEIKNN